MSMVLLALAGAVAGYAFAQAENLRDELCAKKKKKVKP